MRIETSRLVIRSFVKDDIPSYHQIVSDPRVTRLLRSSSPHSLEEAAQYIEATMKEEAPTGIGRYAVEDKHSGKLIGFCGFAQFEEDIDFGWRYGYEHWGKGYGTEAALAVLDFGLNKLGLTSIVAGTAVENVASLRIIEKLGFKTRVYLEFQGRRVVKYYQKKKVPSHTEEEAPAFPNQGVHEDRLHAARSGNQ